MFFFKCRNSILRGSWRGGGPNPISQEIVFFKSQLKSHNPSLCCSNWNPIPIFLLFFFHESQSQCTKSHFPASKIGKSQLPFYPFTTLFVGNLLTQSEAIETYTPYDVTSSRPRKTKIAFFGIQKILCAPEQSLNSKIMNQCKRGQKFHFIGT